jgi:hypothetical protein
MNLSSQLLVRLKQENCLSQQFETSLGNITRPRFKKIEEGKEEGEEEEGKRMAVIALGLWQDSITWQEYKVEQNHSHHNTGRKRGNKEGLGSHNHNPLQVYTPNEIKTSNKAPPFKSPTTSQ